MSSAPGRLTQADLSCAAQKQALPHPQDRQARVRTRGHAGPSAPAAGPVVDAALDAASLPAHRLIAIARSYGPLRAVEPHQAAVVRLAAAYDRSVLPRWQRGGDGVHAWCTPRDYNLGRTWVRRCLGPVPGATGRVVHGRVEVRADQAHLPWRSREHWTDVVVAAAITARPEALLTHRGRVTANTFQLWARTIAQHAHDATGRRCVVRVDRLAELMEVHKSTVQRCQLAAEALGLYVVLEPGRMLTEEETYAARRRGSRQRGMANDAALVVPRWIPTEAIGAPAPPAPDPGTPRAPVKTLSQQATRQGAFVEPHDRAGSWAHDTPTRGRYRKTSSSPSTGSLSTNPRSARASEPPPAAPAPTRKSPTRRPAPPTSTAEPPEAPTRDPHRPPGVRRGRIYDPNALQLARNLTERLPWLRGTSPGRLEPGLRRFAGADVELPWRAGDLVAAIDQANHRAGRASMTAGRVKNPPALLAHYLRELDPVADHPRGHSSFSADPEELVSARTHHNRLLLEAHRDAHATGGAAQTPAVAAAAAAAIRADLRRRHG